MPAPMAPAAETAVPAPPAVSSTPAAVASVPEPDPADLPPPEIERYADDSVEDTAHYDLASQAIDAPPSDY